MSGAMRRPRSLAYRTGRHSLSLASPNRPARGAPCVLASLAPRSRWLWANSGWLLALFGALLLGGCGDTLQDQPIGPAPFESVIVKSRFPVYWLGLRFSGMQVTGVTTDPGGAVTIQYGDCLMGGQYTCVTPLEIVTSPDNSFLPGGATPSDTLALRGVQAASRQQGRAISVRTGGVVVSVYARRPASEAVARHRLRSRPAAQPAAGRRPLVRDGVVLATSRLATS
jgi:hypothetical protein